MIKVVYFFILLYNLFHKQEITYIITFFPGENPISMAVMGEKVGVYKIQLFKSLEFCMGAILTYKASIFH